MFFMLTLLAYQRYVAKPTARRYLTTSILFVCGLLSKPMLVTVPVLLVALDYWPFQKIDSVATFRRAIVGKVPLAVLALISAIVTFVLQEARAHSIAQLPFSWRIQNAFVSYVTYVWQMVWPTRLGLFYPHPEDHLAVWQVAGAIVLLAAITLLVVRGRRRYPYLFVGWLWFVVMLLPVIGIVEVGLQGHADRYTYLPQIGLYIAVTWLVVDLTTSLPHRRQILSAAGLSVVIALAACSYKQTTYWQNGETLWRHTLAVTTDNDIAHTNLGTLLVGEGKFDEALTHFQTALDIRLRSPESALSHYRLSLSLLHDDIGNALARMGRVGEAVNHFRQAVAFQPDYANALYNLGTALFREGFYDEAIEQWTIALSIRPDDAGLHTSMGNALIQKHQLRAALSHFERAAQIDPKAVIALNNRAWILAMCPDESLRDGRTAIQLAQRANALSGNKNAVFMRTLAAAYAEAGDFENAIGTARRAEEIAAAQGQQGLVSQIEDEMGSYRRNEPVRDTSLTDVAKNP
jgi:protein O-mannosyl-transferase